MTKVDKLESMARGALAMLGVAASLTFAACGGVTDSRVEARDRATEAACTRYEMCQQIGPGKMYPTVDDCQVAWRNNWNTTWSADRCTGKINQAELNVCLSAINATNCEDFLDFLATLGKCSADQVCSSTADGGAD